MGSTDPDGAEEGADEGAIDTDGPNDGIELGTADCEGLLLGELLG